MFKTIWVLSLALLFTTGKLVATPTNSFKTDTSDVLIKADSLKPSLAVAIPADPKEGFKDLFVNSSASSITGTMELNPMAITFVEDYMDRFQKSMDELKDWGRPYFDMMDGILESHNLPKELKYLAVIESNLKTGARSWAGAVGPWQFMPTTARNMGLRVNRKTDERRDLAKSTHAASRYLNTLFSMYGDWLLVIAAYNSGPGTVNSAIRRSGSRDFWTLQNYLPLESRNHVKKFIATHYMLEGTGGITTLTKSEALEFTTKTETALAATEKLESISGRYNSGVIVRHIAMELADFNRANPQFDKQISINGKYELRLPAEKMAIFLNKKFDILAESVYLLLNNETASAGSK